MLNKKNIAIFLLPLIFGFVNNSLSQTGDWKIIWDRNPQTDNINHYKIYRAVGFAPNASSPVVAQIQDPTATTPDTIMFVDLDIQPGLHYFYAVQAVDEEQLRSSLSIPASAAIPKIQFTETMVLKVDTTYQLSLNSTSMVVDPDHDPSELKWMLSGSNQIPASINSSNLLTINTPDDTTISDTFQFTVTDPNEFYDTKSMTITLTHKTVSPPPPPPPPPPPGEDDMDKVVAYPVPFVANDPPPCECITFQIPISVQSGKLLIYSVMGDLVFKESDVSSEYNWGVVNSSGNDISPGLYIYYLQNGDGKQVDSGKIVIIR
jgi:hypothetical protein